MEAKRQSALFIGHGSPMNILADNSWTRALAGYASNLETAPRAVVVVSAHWQTRGSFITGADRPPQIYDFYGFPDDLYAYKYAPPGMAELAAEIASAVPGMTVDPKRGVDHAGWAVARHMYPKANVPLLEISLDAQKSPQEHFDFARTLAPFREKNILFIGSGNLVHNLGDFAFEENAVPFGWALKSDAWMKEQLLSLSTGNLIHYDRTLPDYRRSIPTNEHFLPVLYALALGSPGEKPVFIDESIQNGRIAMRSFVLK
jgi:4,5-DOPA dioxygenase extradiol